MPKMKTNRSAAKRFQKSGTGKIMHRNAGLNHLLSKKASDRKRRMTGAMEVFAGDARRIRRMLPYL